MWYNLRTPKDKPPTSSIEILGHDILYQVCSILSERNQIPHTCDHKYERQHLPALIALSATNKTLRGICLPFIFAEVAIHEGHTYPTTPPWKYASRRLETLSGMHMAGVLKHVKIFDFTVFRGQGSEGTPFDVAGQLVSTLSRMPKLQDLTFDTPDADRFVETIKAAGLTFPGVQKLLLGIMSESLISLCPNVLTICTSDKYAGFTGSWVNGEHLEAIDLLKLVLDADFVTELNINVWTLGMVKILATKPEKIRTLSKIKNLGLLPHLSSFSNLESLTLGTLSSLDDRYNPPRCGNYYMGPKGPENRKRIRKQRIEAQKKVISEIEASFGKGRKLHTLVVDSEIWKRVVKDEAVDEKDKFRIGNWTRARTWSDED